MSTLEIIAREVGVSRKTVSNVLNNRNKENWGSTALRAAKIREVAARVGYQPNVMARAVATGRSRIIGLVAQSEDPGSNNLETQSGVLAELTLQDYTAKIIHVPWQATLEDFSFIARQYAMWKVEGVIVIGLEESNILTFKRHLEQVGCMVGFVGGMPPENCFSVYSDIDTSNYLAIEHLVNLGHRRIAFIGGTREQFFSERQAESVRKAMRHFDLPSDESSIVYSAWMDADVIAATTHQLLDQAEPPTAIFCNATIQAMVVLSTARARGLKLPEQLSVLCYGEDSTIAYTDPPLTSLVQPWREMGHLIVRQLLVHIESESPTSAVRSLCVQEGNRLVIRKSTAPPEAL